MSGRKRYKLIACEILFREVCFCVSQSKNIIDVDFMEKGLHDIGEKNMSEKLQAQIDKTDTTKYDAILLGYGLCNNGIRGLKAKLPVIVPRAHDCITLLMGSKEKYREYFDNNPGTYFKSTGWMERDTNPNDIDNSMTSQLGMNKSYHEFVELYGAENAKYIMETMGNWLENYKKFTYIDTHTGNFDDYKKLVKSDAEKRGWEFDEVSGDTNILLRLVNGEWDESDFLIIPPNCKITSTTNDDIVSYEKPSP